MAASDSGTGLLLAGASVDAGPSSDPHHDRSDRTGRYRDGCFVTTVPDIPVVQLPTFEGDGSTSSTAASMWALDVPRGRRPSPLVLAVLGVVAGIAAMALGAAAVISAGGSAGTSSDDGARAASAPPAASAAASVERRVLALLAKPSTERIVFTGTRGLILAVGSGGRAAILVRGLERVASGKPYVAWIVAPGSAPVRAARFVGTERAVFLSGRLGPRAGVVVSPDRPAAARPGGNRMVAARGLTLAPGRAAAGFRDLRATAIRALRIPVLRTI